MMNFITKNKSYRFKLYAIFFWVLMWQLLSMAIGNEVLFPSPYFTMIALKDLSRSNFFYSAIISTSIRVTLGFLLSCVLGIATGLICGLNKHLRHLFDPMITIIKSTPVMSIILIAILWFNSSYVPIFICFLMCYPIIWTNVVVGVDNVDIKLIELSKIYNVKPMAIIKDIYIPTIIPYLFAGIRLGIGLAWKVTIAAEVLSHPPNSIGTHLFDSKIYIDIAGLFAWTIVIITLSYIFENLFKLTTKKIQHKYRKV